MHVSQVLLYAYHRTQPLSRDLVRLTIRVLFRTAGDRIHRCVYLARAQARVVTVQRVDAGERYRAVLCTDSLPSGLS